MKRNTLVNYKRIMICSLLLFSIQVSACASKQDTELSEKIDQATGKEYLVRTAEQIRVLKLLPGDKVILQLGDWKNQQINFKARGTKENPIILTTADPGKVILSGNSTLKIDGEWLIVDGLSFADGYSEKDDVIAFSKTSSNCRLTNTSIVDYNPSDKTKDYKWVSLYGVNNRVDHCTLSGKTHQGTTLVVWLSEQPNYHQIDHNYFGPRPALGVNGGETIRIGTSTWSMHDSYTKVENNVFDRCNGEMEIISNKSGHNTISNNLFYECEGTLTYRHGNNTEVSYNYFIGNNKKNTGGIRIIGENQNVHHNYLQGLAGTGLRAAISVMNAYENPELHEYYQVKNARIESNIIVDCAEAFVLGSGKNATAIVVPDGVKIADNYIINPGKLLVRTDVAKNVDIQNNQLQGGFLEAGFVAMGSDLVKTQDNIWQLKTDQKTPFWLNVAIGPSWSKPSIGN